MIRLILARHGNTFESYQTPVQVGLRTDLPLTEEGKKQAEGLSSELWKTGIVAVYSGALRRQTQTAEIIAKNLPVQKIDALNELDYGPWEGFSADEIRSKWPKEYVGWTEEGIWPEKIFKSRKEDHLRLLDQWFSELRKKYKASDVVVAVTSQGIIRFFSKEKVKTGRTFELFLNAKPQSRKDAK